MKSVKTAVDKWMEPREKPLSWSRIDRWPNQLAERTFEGRFPVIIRSDAYKAEQRQGVENFCTDAFGDIGDRWQRYCGFRFTHMRGSHKTVSSITLGFRNEGDMALFMVGFDHTV
jgi:hypothetical protein